MMPDKPPQVAEQYRCEFRERLQTARKAAKLSQQDMADKLGMPIGIYAKYENRSLLPTREISRAAKLLGTTSEYLLTGEKVKHARYLMRDCIAATLHFMDEHAIVLPPESTANLALVLYEQFSKRNTPFDKATASMMLDMAVSNSSPKPL